MPHAPLPLPLPPFALTVPAAPPLAGADAGAMACAPEILQAGLSVGSPFTLLPARDPRCPLLLVCDHASPAEPDDMPPLGITDTERLRHIGWDIGAAALTRMLAGRFGCAALLSGVSRLVIDCNRAPDSPTLICPDSDGCQIPANVPGVLTAAERHRRLERYWAPYHHAIDAQLAQSPPETVLIALHSFTPVMAGFARPWQIGVLWNQDGRLAQPLLERLRARPELTVGDNEPYSGRLANYTVDRHGQDQGRRHVSLEIRQDCLSAPEHSGWWADLLEPLLRDVAIIGDLQNDW